MVAFASYSDDLVAGDQNGTLDVFVRDLRTGITTLASATPDGTSGNDQSYFPVLSADGRLVAFQSKATDLTPAEGSSNYWFNVFSVTVGNKAPYDMLLEATGGTLDENGTATISGSFVDDDPQDAHHVVIHWGDNTADTVFDLAAGVVTFGDQSHTYRDNPVSGSTFTAAVTVTDSVAFDSGFTSAATTVTVNNVAATPTITGGPSTSPEGTTIDLTGSATDPGLIDQASLTLGWSVTKNGVSYGNTGTGLTYSFTPDDNAAYVVTLIATDKDGGSNITTRSISVNDVAPAVVAPATQIAFGGLSSSFRLGSFFDAGTSDGPWTVTVNWGDGSSDAVSTTNSLGTIPNQSHTYNSTELALTVTISVSDNEGAEGSVAFTVENTAQATNVDPVSLVRDINVSSPGSYADSLTNVNGTLFFIAN